MIVPARNAESFESFCKNIATLVATFYVFCCGKNTKHSCISFFIDASRILLEKKHWQCARLRDCFDLETTFSQRYNQGSGSADIRRNASQISVTGKCKENYGDGSNLCGKIWLLENLQGPTGFVRMKDPG